MKMRKKKKRTIHNEWAIKKKEMRFPASLPSGWLGNDFSLEHHKFLGEKTCQLWVWRNWILASQPIISSYWTFEDMLLNSQKFFYLNYKRKNVYVHTKGPEEKDQRWTKVYNRISLSSESCPFKLFLVLMWHDINNHAFSVLYVYWRATVNYKSYNRLAL